MQQQLSQLETELQMARRYYNGAVRNQNVLAQSFPSNLIAGLFGFGQREYFEISDAADRNVPQVKLAAGPARAMIGITGSAHTIAPVIGEDVRLARFVLGLWLSGGGSAFAAEVIQTFDSEVRLAKDGD